MKPTDSLQVPHQHHRLHPGRSLHFARILAHPIRGSATWIGWLIPTTGMNLTRSMAPESDGIVVTATSSWPTIKLWRMRVASIHGTHMMDSEYYEGRPWLRHLQLIVTDWVGLSSFVDISKLKLNELALIDNISQNTSLVFCLALHLCKKINNREALFNFVSLPRGRVDVGPVQSASKQVR